MTFSDCFPLPTFAKLAATIDFAPRSQEKKSQESSLNRFQISTIRIFKLIVGDNWHERNYLEGFEINLRLF